MKFHATEAFIGLLVLKCHAVKTDIELDVTVVLSKQRLSWMLLQFHAIDATIVLVRLEYHATKQTLG